MEDGAVGRKERLRELLDLIKLHRGWSSDRELARHLGRKDPGKLIVENPKLDYLLAFAEGLDWPVDVVIEYLSVADLKAPQKNNAGKLDVTTVFKKFKSVFNEARQAHRNNQYRREIELALKLLALAQTPRERAWACNREVVGWNGLGHYVKGIKALRRGLRERDISNSMRRMLQVNLAWAHYTLGDLIEAWGIAEVVADWFKENPPITRPQRITAAHTYYVRGHTFRVLAEQEPNNREPYYERGRSDLGHCAALYDGFAEEFDNDDYAGTANDCRGGIVEVEVELGMRTPQDGVTRLLAGLERVVDLHQNSRGEWLESWGWWCVFGANIALRHLNGQELDQKMAIFTLKGRDIAARLENWALHKELFELDCKRCDKLSKATGTTYPIVIDEGDLPLIAGTMARFPGFRPMGSEMINTGIISRER